ncbi:methyltransferase domain-containing protein [Nonomuraea insulae]|uniref:Methyltransferase domain-containing protein n=1 Tax=Nonomuraea insulae TaxID=1616787 RepID=A0ABW1CFA4_9ACTN
MNLATDSDLEQSTVVANRLMNRERRLAGYNRELGVDIAGVLRTTKTRPARWLDLCCGSATALAEAAHLLGDDVEITGVDLVDFFACPPNPPRLHLITASATTWHPASTAPDPGTELAATTASGLATAHPDAPYDLITCVHGLHYLGDKLALLARIPGWLTDDGLFVANFDVHSIRLEDGTPAGRRLTSALRSQGLAYDGRTRRIRCPGRRAINLPYRYLGANDQAGPNYTGQPAVDSHYTEKPIAIPRTGDLS